jgi:ADP-ribosyl-[dinitrogen reductase] hydrolase
MKTNSLPLSDRLAGALWGHLIGDAAGVPYEFLDASEIHDIHFGATGTHQQPPGTWSDDGALMLALLDSLTVAGFDPEDQGRRMLAWWLDGAYTPDGIAFDIGNTTRRSLTHLRAGVPAVEAGVADVTANGNGSLMKILPLALYALGSSDAELIRRAGLTSRITHGHPRAQVACALYCLIIRQLLNGEASAEALVLAQLGLRSYLEESHQEELLVALDFLVAWPDRTGSGVVWDAFWSAWDSFAGASSYQQTIERAIALGDDTDTTAAIAGGLAGVCWGLENIPLAWRQGLRGQSVAAPLIEAFLAQVL